jgi:hypothetical protein
MDTEERLAVPNGVSPFERIRRTNAAGAGYWSSRNFAQVLGHADYRNFEQAMKKAKTACLNSGQRIEDHFVEITEMIAESVRKLRFRRSRRSEALEPPPRKMDTKDTSQEEDGMCIVDSAEEPPRTAKPPAFSGPHTRVNRQKMVLFQRNPLCRCAPYFSRRPFLPVRGDWRCDEFQTTEER